jgi:para-nitrobenzyl esterase
MARPTAREDLTVVDVRTDLGPIRGAAAAGVRRFLGIRFAEPPVGESRFTAPVPAGPWTGTYDAIEHGHRSIQPPTPLLLGGDGPGEISEDCLFLNVHAPAAEGAPRPVVCWIHGGGYTMGSGGDYDPSVLVRQGDVVVVTINYRLGILGFLDLSSLGARYAGSASNGIRDQIVALEWIRDHIAAFGGDPGNVTIAGTSAGAGSVLGLLAAPAADGLYHRAISLTPAGVNAPPGDHVGAIEPLVPGDGPILDRLLTASTDQLLLAQSMSGLMFGSIDGEVVTQHPTRAVATRPGNTVPLVIGTNRHDSTLFSALMSPFPGVFESTTPGIAGEVVRGGDPAPYLARLHADGLDEPAIAHEVWVDLFRRTAVETAAASTARGAPAHLYRFDLPTTTFGEDLGATHGAEIAFAFNWFASDEEVGFVFHDRTDPVVCGLAATWSRTLLAFATTGDPNHAGLPFWPAYDQEHRACLLLDDRPRLEDDPDRVRRLRWTSAAPTSGYQP